MTKTNEMTYPERAGAMSRATRRAACKLAGKEWLQAQQDAKMMQAREMSCINHLRRAGEFINRAAGREQLLFNLEGFEFAREHLLPLLPGMTVEQVRACVHIARTVKEDVTTPEQLKSVRHEMQLGFQALGLADPPRRKELQSAQARNLFSDFVSRTAGLGVLFEELEEEEPMEQWPPDKLQEFLDSVVPVREKIERAEKLCAKLAAQPEKTQT